MKNSPTKRNHRLKEYLRFVRRNERVDGTQRTALLHRISWGRRRSRASRGLEVLDDVTPLVLREANTEHHSWVGFLLCNKKKSEFFLDTTARIGRKPHLRRGLRTQPTHVLRYYSAWIGCGVWETGGRGRSTHQSNDCLFVYIYERRKASKHLIQRATTTTTTEHPSINADGHARRSRSRDVTLRDVGGAFEACLRSPHWRVHLECSNLWLQGIVSCLRASQRARPLLSCRITFHSLLFPPRWPTDHCSSCCCVCYKTRECKQM